MTKFRLFYDKKAMDQFEQQMDEAVRKGQVNGYTAICKMCDYDARLRREALLNKGTCLGIATLAIVGALFACSVRSEQSKPARAKDLDVHAAMISTNEVQSMHAGTVCVPVSREIER